MSAPRQCHRSGRSRRRPYPQSREWSRRFTQFKNGRLRLTNGTETVSVPFQGRLIADDFETIRALAIRGLAVAFLPSFLCADATKQDKLVRLLPQWRGDKVSLSLVYPAQRFVPAKVRAFIAVADEFLKKPMDGSALA